MPLRPRVRKTKPRASSIMFQIEEPQRRVGFLTEMNDIESVGEPMRLGGRTVAVQGVGPHQLVPIEARRDSAKRRELPKTTKRGHVWKQERGGGVRRNTKAKRGWLFWPLTKKALAGCCYES